MSKTRLLHAAHALPAPLPAYGRALSPDPKMEEARRELAWLEAYVTGGEGFGKSRAKAERRAAGGGAEEKSVGVIRPK